MSKIRTLFLGVHVLVVFGVLAARVNGQDIDVSISIDGKTVDQAHVKVQFLRRAEPDGVRRLIEFEKRYGYLDELDKRIVSVRYSDEKGQLLQPIHFDNTYQSHIGADAWSYQVNLAPIAKRMAASSISWVKPTVGILRLDDLLPQEPGPPRPVDRFGERAPRSARVRLRLPAGWRVFTTESQISENEFDVTDTAKAIFIIGTGWREKTVNSNGATVKLLLSGDWTFSDDEAAELMSEVVRGYAERFGGTPQKSFRMAYFKFPFAQTAGEWEGSTVNTTITIASSDMPFKSQSLQRLHEQLRHEAFHFWIPYGLNVTGFYDWFHEGFALYQSLKLGVAVNRLRFEDYLDTLTRAYALDSRTEKRTPLGYMSILRWNDQNNSLIYARGMLVAFLCDLALLDTSDGKRSTDEVLAEIYQRHRAPAKHQEFREILLMLRSQKELAPIVEKYMLGADPIEWTERLRSAGLEAVTIHGATRLAVTAKPSGDQKKLLDKLGYNNWRKLSKGNK